MAGQRVPGLLVHDDRLGLLPGADQPVEVLVMVERVAPAQYTSRTSGSMIMLPS